MVPGYSAIDHIAGADNGRVSAGGEGTEGKWPAAATTKSMAAAPLRPAERSTMAFLMVKRHKSRQSIGSCAHRAGRGEPSPGSNGWAVRVYRAPILSGRSPAVRLTQTGLCSGWLGVRRSGRRERALPRPSTAFPRKRSDRPHHYMGIAVNPCRIPLGFGCLIKKIKES